MKKYISFILCALLLMTALSACGQEKTDTPTPDEFLPPTESSTETPEESDPPATMPKTGYLDFNINDSVKHSLFEDVFTNGKDVYIINDTDNINAVFGNQAELVPKIYNQEYFAENALVVIPLGRGSGSIGLALKHLYSDGSKLTATVTEQTPSGFTDDMQIKVIFAEVQKSDIAGIDAAELEIEIAFIYPYNISWENPDAQHIQFENDDFKLYTFGGGYENGVNRKGTRCGNSYIHWPFVVKDAYELELFKQAYSHKENGENFLDFAKMLDEDYFKEKMFVAVCITNEYLDFEYEIRGVAANDTAVNIDFCVDERNSDEAGEFAETVIIEFNKSLIPEYLFYETVPHNCYMIYYEELN